MAGILSPRAARKHCVAWIQDAKHEYSRARGRRLVWDCLPGYKRLGAAERALGHAEAYCSLLAESMTSLVTQRFTVDRHVPTYRARARNQLHDWGENPRLVGLGDVAQANLRTMVDFIDTEDRLAESWLEFEASCLE